ncbi:MAG: hypothetical protein FJW39_21335 [Acidobacteria bacterium]|nr:hypothetical protein [Acidobacteriota bacterium]
MTDERIRELLASMRGDPVPPDVLARVRSRVEERTRARRAPWFWLAAATAAVVAAVLVWPEPRVVDPPRVALRWPVAPVVVAANRPAPPPVVAQRRVVPGRAPVNLIRIETPDPEVVLFLTGE